MSCVEPTGNLWYTFRVLWGAQYVGYEHPILLYGVFMALKTFRFSNLQFNYTSRMNCNRKLNFTSKMGDKKRFFGVSYCDIGD